MVALRKIKFWNPVVTSFLFSCLISAVASAGLQQDAPSSRDESPHLRFSVNDLVLSQTGSRDKQDTSRLCDGDRILAWNGTPVNSNDELVKAWLDCRGRETVTVRVERTIENDGQPETKTLEVDYQLQYASEIFSALSTGDRSSFTPAIELFPNIRDGDATAWQQALEQQLSDSAPDAFKELKDVFRRTTEAVRGHYRSDHVMFLLNWPLYSERWATAALNPLLEAESISTITRHGYRLASPTAEAIPEWTLPATNGNSVEEISRFISRHVDEINGHLTEATATWTDDERRAWRDWCRRFEPLWRGADNWDPFAAGMQQSKALNVEELKLAFAKAIALADALHPGGALYEKIAAMDDWPDQPSRVGHVQWGSTEDSTHEINSPVLIDPAGDDNYKFPETGLDPELPVRIIVDLAGDDQYEASANGIAAGVGGVSILIDVAGDDSYQCSENGVGFAVGGMGLLVDCDGRDRYRGSTFVQGTACMGLGLIVDRKGNDIYDAGHYSQGVGLPAGLGAILDHQGDDQYLCTGQFPSPYGDAGEFEGMGQGCGFGFRGLASGGIGLIQDRQGRDFYRAGQFGLGCGYFFGIGLVNDHAGDDVFECSRYGLGSAAHYAAGMVLDDAGNDVYLATRRSGVAVLGSAWDLSLGALVDREGDDVYRCLNYALGGSAQNAWGLFHDLAGDDHYLMRPNPGSAGPYVGGANYGAGRGARNLSIFLDDAGTDVYSDSRSNHTSGVVGEYGIWIDR